MTTAENIIKKCMGVYGVNTEVKLSEVTGIPYATLNKWSNDGPSNIGRMLIESLIENVEIRKNAMVLLEADENKTAAIKALKKLLENK